MSESMLLRTKCSVVKSTSLSKASYFAQSEAVARQKRITGPISSTFVCFLLCCGREGEKNSFESDKISEERSEKQIKAAFELSHCLSGLLLLQNGSLVFRLTCHLIT